uniref:Uncharacterized protein n=2 Tax=Anser TaxID=8842 RepID=A0A8B9I6W2_9AVES
ISGSKSSRDLIPETGAALFSKPTSSSNSVANTEEGNLIDGALKQKNKQTKSIPQYTCSQLKGTSSEGPEASFRCCK